MSQAAAIDRDLDGKVAIVTGASNGIGRAAAAQLAARGARVLAVARDQSRLQSLERETGAIPCAISIETAEACVEVVSRARQFGSPTILINSAGRGGYLDRPIFEQTSEDWRQTLAVNLDACFELSRHVALDIRRSGFGRIVMISSTAGEVGAPAMSAYCASKHGVIGLMRSLAHDIAPYGGTCNAVLPSWVRTEMAEQDALKEAAQRGLSADAVWAERAQQNPAGRILDVQEVANVVSFLASAAASGVNGQAITVSIGSNW
ncbi:MAG: SDR family oxidoreductase [Rhizobiales bacterium]|nr:SDR family oxidoreductase [Hyphomicrobiales bacterium]